MAQVTNISKGIEHFTQELEKIDQAIEHAKSQNSQDFFNSVNTLAQQLLIHRPDNAAEDCISTAFYYVETFIRVAKEKRDHVRELNTPHDLLALRESVVSQLEQLKDFNGQIKELKTQDSEQLINPNHPDNLIPFPPESH